MSRPSFERTEEDADFVKRMCIAGVPQPAMARVIGIEETTLRKYFSDVLETALADRVAKASDLLWDKILGGDTTCLIFFLKTRGFNAWREAQKVEIETSAPLSDKTAEALKRAYNVPSDDKDEDSE